MPDDDGRVVAEALDLLAQMRRLGLKPRGYRLTSPHGSGRERLYRTEAPDA